MKIVYALGIAALFVSVSTFGQTQPGELLQWNYNGAALAKGLNVPPGPPGCDSSLDDTAIRVQGAEVDVTLDKLQLELDGSAAPMTGYKNCHIVIPVRIAAGYYLGTLTQMLDYHVQKTIGSSGIIVSKANLIGFSQGRIRIEAHEADAGDLRNTVGVSSNLVDNVADWCNTYQAQEFEGNLIIDVVLTARRSNVDQSIRLAIDNGWRAIGDIYPCSSGG